MNAGRKKSRERNSTYIWQKNGGEKTGRGGRDRNVISLTLYEIDQPHSRKTLKVVNLLSAKKNLKGKREALWEGRKEDDFWMNRPCTVGREEDSGTAAAERNSG